MPLNERDNLPEQRFILTLVTQLNELQEQSEQRSYQSDFADGYRTALSHLASRMGIKTTVRYSA